MIGFILGTSEGRKILSLINEYTDNIAVTTATTYGGQLLEKFKMKNLNTKPLNKEEMLEWIKVNSINILVDASHPYAEIVTRTAIECAEELDIKYLRYERKGALEDIEDEDIIRVKDYDEAINIIKNIEGNVLNTTGGNNVTKFLSLECKYRVIHRILPSPNVLSKIVDAGIKLKDIIALQGPISYELEKAFIKQYDAKAILTKDSGTEGGVLEKYKAAKECNIKLIVIDKPKFIGDTPFSSEEELVQHIVKITQTY
ncbi:cobalt-precorrin-6A reductase [Clostridium sp. YIM B02555]|uniref:cobalt-precorrin-6A reductase n=1 Tax=Clostridium sp. YIM B02555 TaxID=2911968 RepID=UPI001EECFB8C|nr:cobalt-precorrin-6A reductase [Clostridium sp. YIM B02555]